MNKPAPNREENYLVKATLIVRGSEISAVPCKIYLPERIHEKPYVIFKPSEADFYKIMSSHVGAFKASIYDMDKVIRTTIEAPEVYFSGSHTKHWGDDISESTVPGEPQDLHVIHHFRNPEGQDKTRIVFWISPNEFLTPSLICTTSYTGETKYERIRNVEFTIKGDVKLVFDKHFKSQTAENGDFVQWPYLVAYADLGVPAIDVETLKNNILQDIDDFLLVASVALGKRTACLGWTATDKHSHSTYYRGNYTFPDNNTKSNSRDEVIDIQDFESFMETCYPEFLLYQNKLALRNALYSAVPSRPYTIETSFLHIFAGLETLVLDFRRREELEFILPKNKWALLEKYLQQCIKESIEPKLDPEQRASIYNKLGELNRVSLREAFEMFCQKYALDLKDLWPVFGEKGLVGLAEIRNKLIHGDPFPNELYGALVVAKEHLKYTLERVLVRVLGWDIEKTNVNPTYLNTYFPAMKELLTEQLRLSEYIYNQ